MSLSLYGGGKGVGGREVVLLPFCSIAIGEHALICVFHSLIHSNILSACFLREYEVVRFFGVSVTSPLK